jgi:hypothetical protein
MYQGFVRMTHTRHQFLVALTAQMVSEKRACLSDISLVATLDVFPGCSSGVGYNSSFLYYNCDGYDDAVRPSSPCIYDYPGAAV